MGLKPGTYLGQYEVLGLLGVGGMGEVYRAKDSKLNREVALKVLPEQFTRDPERIGRFRREAQVLASLDHPNIARIYAFEETGTARFLVMELVPGETLKEKIREQGTGNREQKSGERPREQGIGNGEQKGGIAVEEAVGICKQIAEGLEHAHEKPVVHRDLKPANVKVTPDGVVKILDFGLAKAFAEEASSDPSDSPTLSAMTQPGTVLGTAAYMAPEQARGRKVDKRADVWALGCVLYEMLAGKRAFDGEDVPEILASVMKGEPDWAALPQTTPASIRKLLQRCLQKDPAKRFHSAADVALEMEEALEEPEATTLAATVVASAPMVVPQPVWRRAIPSVITGLVVAVIVGSIAIWNRPAPPPVSRLVVALPEGERLAGENAPMVALSPDGTQLAYVASSGTSQQIYLRPMDGMEARPLAGTQGAINPFFSPDGQWLGFFAGGNLKKVSVSGGTVLTLGDAADPRGAAWGPDDTIVFTPTTGAPLLRVSASGGNPQELTSLKEGQNSHRWPQFLPDGRTLLLTVLNTGGNSSEQWQMVAHRLDTGDEKVLLQGGSFARYVPTGHLVYYNQAGAMMAVSFDPVRLEVSGTPVPVVENVLSYLAYGLGQFSFSNQGALVYVVGNNSLTAERNMVWVDRQGMETPLPAPPRAYDDPRLSPDGRQVAMTERTTNDIWIYDIPRNTLTRLTFDGVAEFPLWTPDGKRIVFRSEKSEAAGLYWKAADGSGAEEALTAGERIRRSDSISPDGRTLVFEGQEGTTGLDIFTLPLDGERKPQPILQTRFNEGNAMLSPDGRWLAYVSNESGRFEVYVQPYPGPGGKWQISAEGGIAPVWARNGGELFYRNGDKMMAVEIATQQAFSAGTPQMLFERPGYQNNVSRADYDVSPDGQRFLVLKNAQQEQAVMNRIQVVLNWFEELKRRVPAAQ